ncbi:MAG: flagellar biosynthesis protein FlhB [Planctomycetota bacterium]
MPEEHGDKTEEATPQRLREAKKEGQLPQSQEVGSALMIAALLVTLAVVGPDVLNWLRCQVRDGLSYRYAGPMDIGAFRALLMSKATGLITALAPFLAVGLLVSIFASGVSSGLAYCPKAVRIKFESISPVKGIKNLVSWKSLVKLLISIAKLIVIGTIFWLYVRERMEDLLLLRYASPGELAVATSGLVFGLVVRVTIALAFIALLDLLYQRWQYKRKLRMSKKEVKEEQKQYEVSPEVKGRIRQIQMQSARKRMLQDVPDADVVVANPTHFAVALSYDGGKMDAPQVVAKGADLLAQQIKKVAAENGVPVVERPPLARALYASAEVGQSVPENLFVAVAEVLAMVYRMRRKRTN